MRTIIRSSLILSLLILLAIPVQAMAISAITCHCFTDRSYDAARPAAADAYFLATTQNSLFAAAFAVDKKSIVMKKQQGLGADPLWIAHWLAARSGTDPEQLLQAREKRGSWKVVASQLAIPAGSLGERVNKALMNDAPDPVVAGAIVDELLLRFRVYGEPELVAMRKAGAGNQELILSAVLAAKLRQPAIQTFLEVKKGGRTWGALVDRAKLDAHSLGSEARAMVAAATGGKR